MNWSDMSPQERDALVAEKVMGLEVHKDDDPMGVFTIAREWAQWYTTSQDGAQELRHYTTDISAAWEVVEKMGGATLMTPGAYTDEGLGPQESFSCHFPGGYGFGYASSYNSLPEAICLAALRAKGVEI